MLARLLNFGSERFVPLSTRNRSIADFIVFACGMFSVFQIAIEPSLLPEPVTTNLKEITNSILIIKSNFLISIYLLFTKQLDLIVSL